MKYNIYGLLLDVNSENDTVRDFFESKFSSFGYNTESSSECLRTISVSEKNEPGFFQSLDDDKNSEFLSEAASKDMIVGGYRYGYSFKKICNSYVAWNNSDCFFYLADGESHILTIVCVYLLKQVVNALSDIGIICLHGAGVTINRSADNGLLIFGQSGSGKSSISIKLVERYGERIICDDVLMITKRPAGVLGLSNHQHVNIEKENLEENYSGICHCAVKSVDPFNTKVKIDLGKFSQDAFASVITPKNILFSSLRRADKCTIVPLKSTEALKKIVKEVQFYITSEYVPVIYDLIKQCAVYEIIPSRDVDATICEIYRVLSEKDPINSEMKGN